MKGHGHWTGTLLYHQECCAAPTWIHWNSPAQCHSQELMAPHLHGPARKVPSQVTHRDSQMPHLGSQVHSALNHQQTHLPASQVAVQSNSLGLQILLVLATTEEANIHYGKALSWNRSQHRIFTHHLETHY